MRFLLKLQIVILFACTNGNVDNEATKCFRNTYPEDFIFLSEIKSEITSESQTVKQNMLDLIGERKTFKSNSFYGITQEKLLDCLLKSNLKETNPKKFEAIAKILSYAILASLDPTLLEKTTKELEEYDEIFFQDSFFVFCVISVYMLEYKKELPEWKPSESG